MQLIAAIRLTDAVLNREAPRTSAPIARTRRISIWPIVVAVITTIMTVTPIWIAHLHIYARARIALAGSKALADIAPTKPNTSAAFVIVRMLPVLSVATPLERADRK